MEFQADQRQRILFDTVRKLIRRGAKPNLQRILGKSRPEDIANLFQHLSDWEARSLFEACIEASIELAAEVIAETHETLSGQLLAQSEVAQLVALLSILPADDRADLLALLPEEKAAEILAEMGGDEASQVEDLLLYGPETAGGLMVTDFFALHEDATAAESIVKLQDMDRAEMVFYLYCVNDKGHLTGVVSLRQLLTVPRDTPLSDVMIREVIRVPVSMDQEEVARIVARYNILAVPVVDDYNTLLGIITVDDVIDVLREEATEDMLKMAGAAEDDILSKAALKSVYARLPWLGASFAGGLMAAEVIGQYESTLQEVGVLAGFIPVIMGMGGNVGTQSSTLVVRGLATGKLDPRNILWYVAKEMRVGLMMGTVYGLGLGTFAWIRFGEGAALGLTVGTSIFLAMLTAATWGSVVPMVLSRLNVDPAIATGPFVTTTLDIAAIFIYFNLATTFLALG